MRAVLSRLSVIVLDESSRFPPNSATLNGFESGGGLLTRRGSSPLPDPQLWKSNRAGKGRKNHEATDSVQTDPNNFDYSRAPLQWDFARGTSSEPTARRVLPRAHDSRRLQRAI